MVLWLENATTLARSCGEGGGVLQCFCIWAKAAPVSERGGVGDDDEINFS